jgi:mRNA interferase RelE/StbE
VEFEPAARRQFGKLSKQVQAQIMPVIEALAFEPRPSGVIPLKGAWHGYYRVRSGNYRVIYTIEDAALVVAVVKVADRREVY